MNGTFLFYGVNFSIFTAIHYLETTLGPVPYRYIKNFKGKIIENDNFKDCEAVLHVRPKNSNLDYDWIKMQKDLIQEGVLKDSKTLKNFYISAVLMMCIISLKKNYLMIFFICLTNKVGKNFMI